MSQIVPEKDVEPILRRRQLLYNAAVGSLLLSGVLPILALAKTSQVKTSSNKKYCTEIEEASTYEYKSNVLFDIKAFVSIDEKRVELQVYTLKGPFEDAFSPSIVNE